jgi:hypothetical protein
MYMYNRDVNNQLRDQSLHPITHIHDWSPYWLFTSLLHILHDWSLCWLFTTLLDILHDSVM